MGGYPSHLRPVLVHRVQFGLVSSHLIRRTGREHESIDAFARVNSYSCYYSSTMAVPMGGVPSNTTQAYDLDATGSIRGGWDGIQVTYLQVVQPVRTYHGLARHGGLLFRRSHCSTGTFGMHARDDFLLVRSVSILQYFCET